MKEKLEGYFLNEGKKIPTKVHDAIAAIEFEISRKIKSMERTSAKLELSENEKIKIGQEHAFISNIRQLIRAFKEAMAAHLGKIPPHDDDFEMVILGAMMLQSQPTGIDYKVIAKCKTILEPDHFYSDGHQLIFKAITAIEGPTDLMAVTNQLRATGHLEMIGGPHYLAELTARVSSAANMEYHARIVIEFAMKRKMITDASDRLAMLYEWGTDPFEALEATENSCKEIRAWIK